MALFKSDKQLFQLIQIILMLNVISCDDCGPLGYNAINLLRPNYWFFDLPFDHCPSLPEDHRYGNESFINPEKKCRIYFNLCQDQKYQCSGAICARYNFDLVSLMGAYEAEIHPFHEGKQQFSAIYTGEKIMCGALQHPMNVQTRFNFICNKTAFWNQTNALYHGGSIVPPGRLINATFNNITCQFTVNFNSAEACPYIPQNDSPTKPLSYGSLILILFFPGLLLYFILGCLFNRMRGNEGKDMIPHRAFWTDLPELVMDGFLFTMATVTCKHEDRYAKDYDPVQ
eukprot:TCONS_00026598-protein